MQTEPTMIRRPAILVIDDDRTVHKLVEGALHHFNGTLFHAYDGAEGLRIAGELRPELVLTDALLPKLDGRELALRLKSDPSTRAIKVVVMTALYKGTRYRIEAINSFGVDEYIEKPVAPTRLRRLAEEAEAIALAVAS
jgi:CheY-like chemotaxis protein